jgi:cytochrome c5
MKKLLLGLLICSVAFADESQITLKDGPGKDVAVGNCQSCHSLDYIPMNSKFQDHKGWEATVNKMMKAMGASIRQEDVPIIVDYLTQQYGK